MSFGYPQLYANGLNSNSQLRRSSDMIYQRGDSYEIILTGNTLQTSLELDVDLYSDDVKVGRMALVPYSVTNDGTTYTYKFNLRPYSYMQNLLKTEHYQYFWLNDWFETSNQININNPYPNIIKANYKFGYRYINSTGQTITEYSGSPTNNLNHFTDIPYCIDDYSFIPSGFTNTGNYFNYVGGTFQFDENFILQNFDQEIGTVIGTGFTANTMSLYNGQSPICQYLMDYPTVPEQSETGRFLTIAPRIQYIQSDENYVLYYLNGQTGDRQYIEADYAVFEFYDGNNNEIFRYNQELNLSGSTYQSPTGFTDNLKIFALPCGPKDIDNIYVTINWNDVAYYRVQLFYSYPTWDIRRKEIGPIGPVSEAFYFYQYVNCLPESTRLCWLNDQGTYDYFTFRSYRQDTKKIERQNFDNRYYATNLASPDRNIGRTKKTFDTTITQEIVLESYYLTLSQGKWLEQLFYSPQVYLVKPDFVSPIDRPDKIYKDLRPVMITSTQVDTITKKHKKLNKYSITMMTGDSYFVNKGF